MTFGVIGAPNSGKSVLFNFLTGLRQKVANYPGCTVAKKTGRLRFAKEHFCVDLPGTYSLHHQSKDASIATSHVLGYKKRNIDKFIIVCNSLALQRSLGLVLQLKELGIPMMLVLNMEDELLLNGGKIDVDYLKEELGVPVFLLSATKRWNIIPFVNQLRDDIAEYEKLEDGDDVETHSQPTSQKQKIDHKTSQKQRPKKIQKIHADESDIEVIDDASVPTLSRLEDEILRISTRANLRLSESDKFSDRLDAVLLHPIFGRVILFVIALVIFQSIFTWATPMMDGIEAFFGFLSRMTSTYIPQNWLGSLISDGVITGVGSVLVFLPQIFILSIAIGIMEMSGYMARAVFLTDSFFRKIGLEGKVFMPLLTGYACAIPGIMATRTIGNTLDRMLTIFIVPFVSCSARLPVYTVLITAFIPDHQVLGLISIRTVVLFVLYIAGSIIGIGLSSIVKKIYLKKTNKNLQLFLDRVSEIPSYRRPTLTALMLFGWQRVKTFLRRASRVILSVSVIFWILTNTYIPGLEHTIENSIAGFLGKLTLPIFSPMGLDWQSSTAILIGLTAREVFVSAVSVLYQLGSEETLIRSIPEHLNFAAGMALLVYYVYAPQCIPTFAVMIKETKNRLFTAACFLTMFVIAYLLAIVTYQILS